MNQFLGVSMVDSQSRQPNEVLNPSLPQFNLIGKPFGINYILVTRDGQTFCNVAVPCFCLALCATLLNLNIPGTSRFFFKSNILFRGITREPLAAPHFWLRGLCFPLHKLQLFSSCQDEGSIKLISIGEVIFEIS